MLFEVLSAMRSLLKYRNPFTKSVDFLVVCSPGTELVSAVHSVAPFVPSRNRKHGEQRRSHPRPDRNINVLKLEDAQKVKRMCVIARRGLTKKGVA